MRGAVSLTAALLLGILQGLTEFLPISSSGHLVLLQSFLRVNPAGLGLELALHLGTLLAVVMVFRREVADLAVVALRPALWRTEQASGLRAIAISTVCTGLVALALRAQVSAAYESVRLTGFGFLLSTVALFSISLVRRGEWLQGRGTARAIIVGVVQGVAAWPGLSRSGATIAAGLWSGMDQEAAARYSFLLSVPTIVLASAAQFLAGPAPHVSVVTMAVAVLASAVTGTAALLWLLRIVRQGHLAWFGLYTLALALLILVGMQ